MSLVDLTLSMANPGQEKLGPDQPYSAKQTMRTREWRIGTGASAYAARVHYLDHWSMAGTYLDFPGHIAQTDDGVDAGNAPLPRLYRLDATVIHLDRGHQPGRITEGELTAACPAGASGQALVVHALGNRRFDEIEYQSLYLGRDAVAWIIGRGTRLLVADVYESHCDPQDVFRDLFRAGLYAVCHPVNLHRLTTPHVELTVLPLRVPGATQLPCRVVAEQNEDR